LFKIFVFSLGTVGVGGSLHNIEGNTIVYYTWGLGNILDNPVEAYSLLCGISIAKEEGVISLLVFGDSMLVIKAMIFQ